MFVNQKWVLRGWRSRSEKLGFVFDLLQHSLATSVSVQVPVWSMKLINHPLCLSQQSCLHEVHNFSRFLSLCVLAVDICVATYIASKRRWKKQPEYSYLEVVRVCLDAIKTDHAARCFLFVVQKNYKLFSKRRRVLSNVMNILYKEKRRNHRSVKWTLFWVDGVSSNLHTAIKQSVVWLKTYLHSSK